MKRETNESECGGADPKLLFDSEGPDD